MTRTITLERSVGNVSDCDKPAKVSRHWADPIAAAVAKQMGYRPGTVEKVIRQWPLAVATVVREMRRQHADKRCSDYVAPILKAIDGREAPPDCAATWELIATADSKEDIARARYLRDSSVENRERLITAIRAELQNKHAELDLLVDTQWREQKLAERT